MISHSFTSLEISVESGLVEQADNMIKTTNKLKVVVNFCILNNTIFLNFKANGSRAKLLAFNY